MEMLNFHSKIPRVTRESVTRDFKQPYRFRHARFSSEFLPVLAPATRNVILDGIPNVYVISIQTVMCYFQSLKRVGIRSLKDTEYSRSTTRRQH